MARNDKSPSRPAYISKAEMRQEPGHSRPTVPQPPPSASGTGAGQWIIAGFLFFAFLCTIPFWTAGDDAEHAPEAFSAHAKVAAYSALKREVLARLKAPATASFASVTAARYSPAAGDGVTVHAYVDSQNTFGANIRTQFAGTAQPAGESWRVTALDIE